MDLERSRNDFADIYVDLDANTKLFLYGDIRDDSLKIYRSIL